MANTYAIVTSEDRSRIKHWVDNVPPGTRIAFKKGDRRNNDQNAMLWFLLSQIAEQKPHGLDYPADHWKCLFMDQCKMDVKHLPSLDGQRIVSVFRSSRLSKEEFSDLIECIYAWCAENGVKFKQDAA